jgi:AraC-like DNA-binding protein
MDLLSDVLRDLRLRSAVLSLNEFRAPWGFDKPSIAGAAPFHVVVDGGCLLVTGDQEVCDLAAGDMVIMPHGHPHGLQSDRSARRVPFHQLLEDAGIEGAWSAERRMERLARRRFGADGPATLLLSGIFTFGHSGRNSLLESLPPVIRARVAQDGSMNGLSGLDQLMAEADAGRPGFQTIAERMADILFVQAVRDFVANLPEGATGWLRGLTDPHIARVLSLVHEQPEEAWTLALLASKVALSRTVLSNRFQRLVGTGVISYLTARRMHVASEILTSSRRSMADIANAVGYESEISFSRAFRRWAGMPPGEYRRTAS